MINPEDNVVTYKTQDKTGLYIIPVILNGFNDEFIYEDRATAQVSLEKALQMLNDGVIDKTDFFGDVQQILANNSIRNNSTFNVDELRIGAKTIKDITFTVSHRQQNPITLGREVMERIGRFSIDEEAKTVTFKYREEE